MENKDDKIRKEFMKNWVEFMKIMLEKNWNSVNEWISLTNYQYIWVDIWYFTIMSN